MEAWAIVACVAILSGIGYEAVKVWARKSDAADAGRLAELEQRVATAERLEERVRTLEQIVTDRGYQVSDEISRLERSA